LRRLPINISNVPQPESYGLDPKNIEKKDKEAEDLLQPLIVSNNISTTNFSENTPNNQQSSSAKLIIKNNELYQTTNSDTQANQQKETPNRDNKKATNSSYN